MVSALLYVCYCLLCQAHKLLKVPRHALLGGTTGHHISWTPLDDADTLVYGTETAEICMLHDR